MFKKVLARIDLRHRKIQTQTRDPRRVKFWKGTGATGIRSAGSARYQDIIAGGC